MRRLKYTLFSTTCALTFLGLSACKSPSVTEPNRSAIEQLLLSHAVDEAVAAQEIDSVRGRKVYFSEKYLESYDSRYVSGTIRALLSESGAHLVNSAEEADVIVEARSGALGIDSSSTLVGLPSIPIIIPSAGTISLPNLALYKSERADSVTKLALLAYEAGSGTPVFSSDSYVGKSHYHQYTFLFLLNLNLTDIPERESF